MTSGRARRLGLALAAVVGLSLALAGPMEAHGPSVKVIAKHLNNPRGVAVTRDGRVLVAAAGLGGPGGYGLSGKIAAISGSHVRTIRGRLPSAMSPEGDITGVVNVAVGRDGRIVALFGAGPQNVNPMFNTLVKIRGHRTPAVLADIQAYQNTDPDPTDIDQPPNPTDSNPYGIAAISHGRTLVTDAAGNDLLLIHRGGTIETVARFPNELITTDSLPPSFGVPPGLTLPAEAVPTSVAVGPDGYWYVGELKGFPFQAGTSRIWRIAPWARNVTCDPTATSGPCTLWMDGFTSIVGLAWGRNHALYVSEIVKTGVAGLFAGTDTVGALLKVKHGIVTELVPGRLTAPGGVAVGRNGAIYIANNSVSIGGGEVLRIKP